MSIFRARFPILCIVCLFVVAGVAVGQQRQYRVSSDKKDTRNRRDPGHHGGVFALFSHPAEDSAAEQLLYANGLLEAGKVKQAGKQYKALVHKWPESSEAATAQLRYAETLQKRGKLDKAFDEYQYLIEAYSGFFPYDEVVKRQLDIAEEYAARRRWFLFVPYKAPEDALPMFEKIIQNAPYVKGVDRIQLRIADLYLKAGQEELAIDAYLTALERYPGSPVAEEAAHGYAISCVKLSERYPNSNEYRRYAAQALSDFLRRYPGSEYSASARLELQKIRMKQAKVLYEQARIYDRRTRHPKSAVLMYELLIKEFPESRWVSPARIRVSQIKQKYGDSL